MTPRRRRWLRRLLFVLILAGAAYFARQPLLRGLAGFLVVEDPVREADAACCLTATAGRSAPPSCTTPARSSASCSFASRRAA